MASAFRLTIGFKEENNMTKWEQVKAAYDADNKAFTKRHLWD